MKLTFATTFILSTLVWTEFLPSGHKNTVPRPQPHPHNVAATINSEREDDFRMGDILNDIAIFDPHHNVEVGI